MKDAIPASIDERLGPDVGRLVVLGLTPAQARVYLYLFEQTARLGYQPSLQDIAVHFGFASRNGVLCHVRALCKKGWLEPSARDSRSIRFLRRPGGGAFYGFRAITGTEAIVASLEHTP